MYVSMKPLISVIIPVYNASSSIGKCVSSILEQTFDDFELILVDDGSTDDSLRICQKMALQDRRIIVVSQSNKGVSSARNQGLALSHGVWIAFVDADDYLEASYFEKMYASSDDNDLVVGGYNKIIASDDESRVGLKFSNIHLSRNDFKDSELWDKLFLYGTPWGKLFRSSLIKNNGIQFPSDFSLHEDHIFFFTTLLYSKSIGLINYCGYNYVDNGGVTLSRGRLVSSDLKWNAYFILSQKFNEIVKRYNLDKEAFPLFQNFRIRLYISAVILCYRNKSYCRDYISPTKELRKQILLYHKPTSRQGHAIKVILAYFPFCVQRLILKILIR